MFDSSFVPDADIAPETEIAPETDIVPDAGNVPETADFEFRLPSLRSVLFSYDSIGKPSRFPHSPHEPR